jgi:hypothetical protein
MTDLAIPEAAREMALATARVSMSKDRTILGMERYGTPLDTARQRGWRIVWQREGGDPILVHISDAAVARRYRKRAERRGAATEHHRNISRP